MKRQKNIVWGCFIRNKRAISKVLDIGTGT